MHALLHALSFVFGIAGIGFMYVPVRDHSQRWRVANRTVIIGFILVCIAFLFHWSANWATGKPLW